MANYIGNRPTAVPLTSSDLEDSIITSAKIVDGTIVNADVNDLASSKLTGAMPAVSGASLTSLTPANLASAVPVNKGGTGLTAVGSANQVLATNSGASAVEWQTSSGFDVSSITGATALDAQPASTDELVMSDAGTLKRVDFSHLNQHKHFFYMRTSDPGTISWNSLTLLGFNWKHDPESLCDISAGNHKFTAPEAGKYFFAWTLRIQLASGNAETTTGLFKNGSSSGISTYDGGLSFTSANNINSNSLSTGHFIFNVAEDDYFQMKGYTYQYSATNDSNIGTNTCSLMGWQLD